MLIVIRITSSYVLQGIFLDMTFCWMLPCLTGMELTAYAAMCSTIVCRATARVVVGVTVITRVAIIVLVSAIGVVIVARAVITVVSILV